TARVHRADRAPLHEGERRLRGAHDGQCEERKDGDGTARGSERHWVLRWLAAGRNRSPHLTRSKTEAGPENVGWQRLNAADTLALSQALRPRAPSPNAPSSSTNRSGRRRSRAAYTS